MMPLIRHAPCRAVLLLMGTLLLVGLGPGPVRGQPPSCSDQQRLITRPVDVDIERHIIERMVTAGATQTLQKFDFKDGKLPPELGEPVHQIREMRVEGGLLKFQTTGNDPYFTLRGLGVPAKEVLAIAVRVSAKLVVGRREDLVKIHFANNRYPEFESERSMRGRLEADGRLRTVVLFPSLTPGWGGTVTGLRVDPVEGVREVAIEEISLLKAAGGINFSTLGLPPTMSVRSPIDRQLQTLVFARFDTPVEWTLTLPCEPEFNARFALPRLYGFIKWSPFYAQVEVRGRTEGWTTVAKLPVRRSERRLLLPEEDLKVPLDRWSGQEVTLRLRVLDAGGGSAQGGLVYWINPYVSSRASPPKRPNIILISIDTLRADHLSLYGYPRRTSPSLEKWASKGVVFDYAISPSPWTLPSHASVFTSLYPSQHQALLSAGRGLGIEGEGLDVGFEEHGRLSGGFQTLAERLREGGYITAGFAGGIFVSSEVGLDQGFDTWYQRFVFEERLGWISDWLRRHSSARFFLFLHTYEVHDYHLSRELANSRRLAEAFYRGYRGKVMEEGFTYAEHRVGRYNRTTFVEDGYEVMGLGLNPRDYPSEGLRRDDILFLEAMYDGQIRAVDEVLGRFFEVVSEEGLENKTVVIVMSDHGEEFNEHGGLGHMHSLYDEMLRVPLIMSYPPSIARGLVVASQVRLIDLYPTILELAGLPVPEGLEGRSLLPLLNGGQDGKPRRAYVEEPERLLSGVRTQKAKYIYSGGERSAFDLMRDPQEKHPEEEPSKLRGLAAFHDRFTAKNGGYHLLAQGPRLDGCPIRLRTDGRFLSAVGRFTEEPDLLRVDDRQIDVTFFLEGADLDGLYFLVSSDSEKVEVEVCPSDGRARDGLEVLLGAGEPLRMGRRWTVGGDVSLHRVRVESPPATGMADLGADAALWRLDTKPAPEEGSTELSPERMEEFLRRLRDLGYLE